MSRAFMAARLTITRASGPTCWASAFSATSRVWAVKRCSASAVATSVLPEGTGPEGRELSLPSLAWRRRKALRAAFTAVSPSRGAASALKAAFTNAWQSSGNGQCNTNNHSQWNCEPPTGNRFHYATRDWVGDGGSSSNTTWTWFTGYENAYASGNYAQLVKNWDGQYNKTPHELFFR